MSTSSDLNQLSFRSYLSSVLSDKEDFYSSLNGLCLRFSHSPEQNLRVNSILNSDSQKSILSVLENVETKRCPAAGTCAERDNLVKLYLSEESVLNKELVDLLLPTIIQTPDGIFHNYGINYLFLISFFLNLYFIYRILNAKLPVKRTRSKKFAYLKYFIPTFFLACYAVSYYKFYKEAVASRLATSTRKDPCLHGEEFKMSDFLSSLLTVSSEKSDCQRFIESHVGWAFLDVNPIDPLLDLVGKVLFGWISPLGHHLNQFYRKIVLGVPLALQIVLLVITILVILSSVKYWKCLSFPSGWLQSKSKREKLLLEELSPLGKLSWRDPTPEPVKRTTRATTRRTPAAKSRSRTRKEE